MSRIAINRLSDEPEKEYLRSAKRLVLGKDRPPLFTRVILMVALVCFAYYFLWNGLRVVALNSIDAIENPEQFKAAIQKLGDKYGLSDALTAFRNYGLVMVISWGVVATGMVFIWRRKLVGYYFFFVGLLAALVTPFIFLGWEYSTAGSDGVDFYDFIIPPVLGAIFFVSFKRLRKLKEEAKLASVA